MRVLIDELLEYSKVGTGIIDFKLTDISKVLESVIYN